MRQLADRFAQHEHAGLQRLLAGEGEQLAYQRCSAQRVLMHFVDLAERRISGCMAHQKKFAIADDDGEKIVEVMRHTTRELPDRLHLLGLGEFGLKRFLFGDIEQIKRQAAVARKRTQMDFGETVAGLVQRQHRAVLSSRARERFADGDRLRGRRKIAQGPVRDLARSCEEFPERPVRFADGAILFGYGNSDRRFLKQRGVPRQRDGQFLLRRFGGGRGRFRRSDAGREPPAGAALRQRPYRAQHLISAGQLERLLMRQARDGFPVQPIEHGRGALRAQRNLRRRRRLALAHTGDLPIDLVAMNHRAVGVGYGPGNIGPGGGFRDVARLNGADRRARPDGIEDHCRNGAKPGHESHAEPAGCGRHGDHQPGGRDGTHEQAERHPAPGTAR